MPFDLSVQANRIVSRGLGGGWGWGEGVGGWGAIFVCPIFEKKIPCTPGPFIFPCLLLFGYRSSPAFKSLVFH